MNATTQYSKAALALRAHEDTRPPGVIHSPTSGLLVGTNREAKAWVAKRRDLIGALTRATNAIPEKAIRAALRGR